MHCAQIFDVAFNPHTPAGSPVAMVTCGVKHVKFWTLSGNTLSGKKGIFGRKGEVYRIASVVSTFAVAVEC